MATVRVVMDEAAIHAMASDWTSPVGQYIERLTEEVFGAAKVTAPVSPRGSKYAPPGYLRGRVNIAHQHQPDGVLLGMVGVPIKGGRGGNRYPLMFICNLRGSTRNANQYGHYGYRVAQNYFLLRALQSIRVG